MATNTYYTVLEQRAQTGYEDWHIHMQVHLTEYDALLDCFKRNFQRWKDDIKLCGVRIFGEKEEEYRLQMAEKSYDLMTMVLVAISEREALTLDIDELGWEEMEEINQYFIRCLSKKSGGAYRYYTVEANEVSCNKRPRTG